ncbi:MAG: PIN domain-containing protein [archaeon]
MKLVIDSNVLFTFFWKNSALTNILEIKPDIELFSPEYALTEITNNKLELLQKTKLSASEFDKKKNELAEIVSFIPLKEYSSSIKEIKSLTHSFPEHKKDEILKDADFLALALQLNVPLWSNDKLLRKQPQIPVLSTADMIELLS